MDILNCEIVLCESNAVVPSKAHKEDAGYDLIATSVRYDDEIDCYVYSTGLAIGVPIGYSLDVIPKSRNRKVEFYMPNTPATIDPGYTGIIQVSYKSRLPRVVHTMLSHIHFVLCTKLFDNLSIANKFKEALDNLILPPYKVGEAVAQCYITPHPEINFKLVDKLPETLRGDGGHGSTKILNH